MEGLYVYMLLCALAFELAAAILLVRRTARMERRQEEDRKEYDSRLAVLERFVRALEDENDAAPEASADDRKKAREAERRFTEGVANILGFSCAAGRKGD